MHSTSSYIWTMGNSIEMSLTCLQNSLLRHQAKPWLIIWWNAVTVLFQTHLFFASLRFFLVLDSCNFAVTKLLTVVMYWVITARAHSRVVINAPYLRMNNNISYTRKGQRILFTSKGWKVASSNFIYELALTRGFARFNSMNDPISFSESLKTCIHMTISRAGKRWKQNK